MKKLIFIIGLFYSIITTAQIPITAGMTGLQLRNALNTNFDTLYTRTENPTVPNLEVRLDSIENTNREYYNVLNYGAVGDGITSDVTAINAAINAAIANDGIVFFPSGNYKISGALTYNVTRKKIRVEGSGNAKITGTNNPITFTTTVGTADTFVTDPIIGNELIYTTALYNTVQTGDILLIQSTDDIVNSAIGQYKKGELVKVRSVSTNKIYLTAPLYSGYNKATTTIRNLNAGTVKIYNMNFDSCGVSIYNNTNSEVRGCTFYGFSQINVDIGYTFNSIVDNCVIDYATTGYYGMAANASQNVNFTNNKISNMAQAIEAGGTIPSRNLLYAYNTISCFDLTAWAQVGSHATCQFVKIIGNKIYNGGIYAVGQNIDITNNTIDLGWNRALNRNVGIERVEEDLNNDTTHTAPLSRYMNISDNIILSHNAQSDNMGIFINFQTFRDTIDWVNINNNYIRTTGYAILFAGVTEATNCVRNLTMQNNYLESEKLLGDYYTIFIGQSATILNLLINNNILNTKGQGTGYIGTARIQYCKFINNTVYESDGRYPSLYFANIITSTNVNLIVENNNFLNSDMAVTGTWDFMAVKNNNFTGQTSSSVALELHSCDSVYFEDNIYSAVISATAVGGGSVYRNETGYFTGKLSDGAPTDAEINACVSKTAAQMQRGYKAIIQDSDGSKLIYTCESDGTNWLWKSTTKAL